jgi:hypothetical protein
MASNDPQFETKAADVIGLHLNPSAHTAVFCADEKIAIQALDRLDPVLPLSPARLERHGFESSLYAAFNTKTGEVLGKTAAPAPSSWRTVIRAIGLLKGRIDSELVVRRDAAKRVHHNNIPRARGSLTPGSDAVRQCETHRCFRLTR